ncbi:MAG: type IV secretory pathway VirB10-like protein [Brevundimonas sp.]|jgi:type IV secretory pathway VirB10-like protein|uniref:TrbI/VirB10 family protein n=1 Tax=Brevundimonas sp. TaxID=1871086 RepID=UPI0039E6C755
MTPNTDPDPAAAPPDDAPAPKAPPPLDLRAPRPSAVRIRAPVIRLAVFGAGALVAGALTWAFVVQPELRASAFARRAAETAEPDAGAARPSQQIWDQPARYDHLNETLPPPRGRPAPAEPAPGPAAGPAPRPAQARPGPSPAETAAASGLFFARAAVPQTTAASAAPPVAAAAADSGRAPAGEYAAVYSPHGLIDPLSPYELQAGAMLPATLLTAIDTGRPGPVIALVSQDVFDSVTGRHRLVPQGARLIGRQDGDSAWGERRAFVVWERLILPDGRSVRLAESPGVDAQGAAGVRGQADRRLVPLGVAALFAGAITTLGEFARGGSRDDRSWSVSAGDAASIEAARVGGRMVDRELDVRPSIRVSPGAPVRVLIIRDLILEPWTS